MGLVIRRYYEQSPKEKHHQQLDTDFWKTCENFAPSRLKPMLTGSHGHLTRSFPEKHVMATMGPAWPRIGSDLDIIKEHTT
jgi:hypothetical protein